MIEIMYLDQRLASPLLPPQQSCKYISSTSVPLIKKVLNDLVCKIEIGVHQQRDQCHNFTSGLNFMDKTFDWIKWPI